MIDLFKKIAEAVQFLRIPSVLLGIICVIAITIILIGSNSRQDDFFVIPSVVGLIWSMTTYGFLVYFRTVPEKANKSWKFLRRVQRKIVRAAYWMVGVIFIATTIGVIFMSYRMITIWLNDYS